ncbi:glucosaminidase domain-containing protein [Enterococcus sp. 669A]|uniref:Glucosaminidase domain-containing protein n=1 Tax=Candidatus Enterococcus moelleringii TaxID=2815325 RepID=A0ABS3L6S7_9ENTE|nr:glucosaminidase domain-containing protein [Enterococcus sp. 669A]MBO1305300.1 glucosaminidase domain-containing protein [Enterococcus sp. 669A]
MKGKVLLVLGCLLLTGCQKQVKQTVLAETKESSAVQSGVIESAANSPAASSEAVSSVQAEPESTEVSSIEEGQSSESLETQETQEIQETPDTSSLTTVPSESAESTDSSVAQEEPEVVAPVQTPLPTEKVEENYQFSVVKNQTTEEFIQTIGSDAQQIAWDNGLYASVMIAQAILETGSGNSQLARPPHHNLFGIKGSYQGKNVSFNTQEDKGDGQLYTIQSAFRQYPSYKESLEDYAALLKNGLSGNSGFYQATWKGNAATYREATKALTGKYATDTSYDKKLNALIETYELDSFDQEPEKELAEPSSATSGESTTETSEGNFLSSETINKQVKIQETEQPVQKIPGAAQRPANQLSGSRNAQ